MDLTAASFIQYKVLISTHNSNFTVPVYSKCEMELVAG